MANLTRVFISSTGRDLADYRQKAIEICMRFGFHPVAMEYFEAMGMGATAGSLSKVEESDLYLGIFAHRYGYIEPGYTQAVTELEFEHAVKLGLSPLCFMLDPHYPWPPDAIDFENKQALDRFKYRIEKYYIRGQFSSVEDFAVKMTQSLVAWQRQQGLTNISLKEIPKAQRIVLLPPRPMLLLGRDTDLVRVKTALSQAQRTSIIRGWPGIGKTTFVQSLAYDEDLEKRYPDGVLWATLGTNPDIYGELKHWGKALGKDTVGLSVQEAAQSVKALLNNKAMLLIADDIWNASDAQVFRQVLNSKSALIFTTRSDAIAKEIADLPETIHYLNPLSPEKSLELLKRLAPAVVAAYPQEMEKVVHELEGSPLSIKIAARLLDKEHNIQGDVNQVIQEIQEGLILGQKPGSDRNDPLDPETGEKPTVYALLRQSTERLEPNVRQSFALLGTMAPKPATFDLESMAYIWDLQDPLPITRQLVDWGLLEPLPSIARFQLHALLVQHAKALLNDGKALAAPAKHSGSSTAQKKFPPLHPDVDANTDENYKQIYLKPLYLKLEMLQRDFRKGKDVGNELEHTRAEIERLGHNPDKRG